MGRLNVYIVRTWTFTMFFVLLGPRETTQPFRDMMMRTDAGTSTAAPPIVGLSGTTSTQSSFVSATGSDTDLRE